MSRRVLALISLLLVADAVLVNGRAPRPVTLNGQNMLEMTRIHRLQTAL
jgi:hypothetical protein